MLGALTLFGLLAALLGTDFWHVASWITLSVPLVAGLWHSFVKKREKKF